MSDLLNLSPDQLRKELAEAREKIRSLENRVKSLEHPGDEPVTVLTRPEFNREVARMLAFDERYGGISSVLYFDFENLEEVSGRFDKSVMNAAIREISTILTRSVRTSDVVGRLAADEFGVLLMRCDNSFAWKKGEQLANALQEALSEVHGCKLNLDISYGAYTFRGQTDLASGLKEAALAMTKMKIGE